MEVLSDHNWVLTVGTFLPLVGVLIMLFIPKTDEVLSKSVAIATAAATLAVGIFTLIQFNYDHADKMQFAADAEWISVIKSSYLIGIDGISLPLYFLSMVITLLVMIYSWNHVPSPGNAKAFCGVARTVSTHHPSSSCTPCSVQRSCWLRSSRCSSRQAPKASPFRTSLKTVRELQRTLKFGSSPECSWASL